MPHVVIPTQIIVQLPNDVQPPQWNAPVLMSLANVVVNESGTVIYQPAYSQRPMASDEFTAENLSAINAQLLKLGLQITKIGGNDAATNPE